MLVPPGHITSSLLIPGALTAGGSLADWVATGDPTKDPELDKLVSGLIGSMRKAEAEGKPPPRALLPEGAGPHDVPDRHDTTKSLNAWLPPVPCRCDLALNHNRTSCHLESLLFGDKRRWCRVQHSDECPHQFRYCSRRPFDVTEKELEAAEVTASSEAKEERDAVPRKPVREVSNKVREQVVKNSTLLDQDIHLQIEKAAKEYEKHGRLLAKMKDEAKAHGAVAAAEEHVAAIQQKMEALLVRIQDLRQKAVANETQKAHVQAVEVVDAGSELSVAQAEWTKAAEAYLHQSEAMDAKVDRAKDKVKAKEEVVQRKAKVAAKVEAEDARVVKIWKAKEAQTNAKIHERVQVVKAARSREAESAERQSDQGIAVKAVSERQAKETLQKWKAAEALVETRSQKWRQAERDAAEARAKVLQAGFDVQLAARGVADAGREMRQAAKVSWERKQKLAVELRDEKERWHRRVGLAQGKHKRERRLERFAEMRVKQIKERMAKEIKEKDKVRCCYLTVMPDKCFGR